jgi:hypothetical protein
LNRKLGIIVNHDLQSFVHPAWYKIAYISNTTSLTPRIVLAILSPWVVIEINYTPNGLETGLMELNWMAMRSIVMRKRTYIPPTVSDVVTAASHVVVAVRHLPTAIDCLASKQRRYAEVWEEDGKVRAWIKMGDKAMLAVCRPWSRTSRQSSNGTATNGEWLSRESLESKAYNLK